MAGGSGCGVCIKDQTSGNALIEFLSFFLFNCKQQMTSLAILYKNEIIGNARQEYRIHRRPEDKIWKMVRKRRALEVWAAESWLS